MHAEDSLCACATPTWPIHVQNRHAGARWHPPHRLPPFDMTLDIDHLRSRIHRAESVQDVATVVPLRALSATLDRDARDIGPGSEVPPCWHGLYFLPLHRQSGLGPDGHARRGCLLPPVPLLRRMCAGSRIRFRAPVRVGQAISRHSQVADVRMKEGRTGQLVFVNVYHEIRAEG